MSPLLKPGTYLPWRLPASESEACSAESVASNLDLSKPVSATPFSTSNENPSANQSLPPDGPVFRAITTCGMSVQETCPRVISWSVASPAKTSATRGAAKGLKAKGRASGPSMPESSGNVGPGSSSSKTWPHFSSAGPIESCETLPRSGMMRSGKWSPLSASAPGISAIACSSSPTIPAGWLRPFPTPVATDSWAGKLALRKCKGWENGRGWTLGQVAVRFPTPMARDWKSGKVSEETLGKNSRPLAEVVTIGQPSGQLNPLWVEWLMGFPPGWTESRRSETLSSQKWLDPSAWKSCEGGGLPEH